MGGIGTALSQDVFASYFNPAGLAFARPMSVGGSFVRPVPFLGSTAHSYIALAANVESFGAIGLSANLFWKGKQLRTGPGSPDPIGAEDLVDWQYKVSYAHLVSDIVSVGTSISFLRENLSEFGTDLEPGTGRSTSVMFDAGILFKDLWTEATWNPCELEGTSSFDNIVDPFLHRGVSIGMSLLNVGPKISFIDPAQSDFPPSLVSLGVAYSPIRSNFIGLLIEVDLEKQLFEHSMLDYVHWGSEVRMGRFVSLRGGYFEDTYGPKNSYWTWGAGVHLKFVSINVARYTRMLLPSWHVDGTLSWEI
jgi:hypothetical protein